MDNASAENESFTVKDKVRLWSGYFIALIAVSCLLSLIGNGLNTGTSVYVGRIGGSTSFAGLLALIFSVGAGVTRILAGPIIDRRLKVRVAAMGAFLLAVSTAIPLFLNTQDVVLAIARGLQGAGFALSTTACAVAAEDILPRERFGEGVGYFGLSQAFAMALGPALGLILVGMEPASNIFLGFSILSLIAVCVFLLCRYDEHPERIPQSSAFIARRNRQLNAETISTTKSKQFSLRDTFEPRAFPAVPPMVFFSASSGFFLFFAAKYGVDLGINNPEIVFITAAISMVILRASSGAFMDKIKPQILFSFGMVAGFGCFGCFILSELNATFYYLAGLLFGISMGISIPTCQTVAVMNCPSNRWGAATAMCMLSMDIGIGIGSTVWGYISDIFGYSVALVVVEITIIIALILAWAMFPNANKRNKQA